MLPQKVTVFREANNRVNLFRVCWLSRAMPQALLGMNGRPVRADKSGNPVVCPWISNPNYFR